MTVTEIVKDLLEHNMITIEAGTVLLDAESKAKLFDKQDEKYKSVFQPYHGFPNTGTTNPYYVSTTTNDNIKGTTTELSAATIELLKTK